MSASLLSPVTALVLSGAGAGLGLVWIVRLAFPAPPDVAHAVQRWEQGRATATARRDLADAPLATDVPGLRGRGGRWVGDRLRARIPIRLAQLAPDLAITQTTLEAWIARCLGTLVVALVGPFAVVAILRGAGLGLPLVAAPVGGAALAIVMAVIAVRDLRADARRRREDFRRGLSIYTDLVAMSLEAGRGHPDALPAAARIGTGWIFTELSDAVDLAPTYGETAWEALGRLGERYAIPELIDLRGTLNLAQHDGAKIRATLVARAATLREARITEAHARADTATDTMTVVTILMATVVVAYIVFPQVMRLLTS